MDLKIPNFQQRVRQIPWSLFATAYGPADEVGNWLVDLTSSDRQTAMHATHQLWCSLCHQHAYISSAAAPALLFLFEVADAADDELLVELLDIFLGFAVCSRPPGSGWPTGGPWVAAIHESLVRRRNWFEHFLKSSNEDVAGFAESVLHWLT